MLPGQLALLGGDQHDAVAPDLGVDRLQLLQDGAAGVVVGAGTTVFIDVPQVYPMAMFEMLYCMLSQFV